MLDVVRNETSRNFCLPFQSSPSAASPELTQLSRQTQALEYIASELCLLSARVGQAIDIPVELQPDYELATRRLLMEAV